MPGHDYVIIGAGCVLAARLSQDPAVSVMLPEAGGRNIAMTVRMPAAVIAIIKARNKHNWGFWTLFEPNLDNRKLW